MSIAFKRPFLLAAACGFGLALGAKAGWAALPGPMELTGEWDLLAGHDKDAVAAAPGEFAGWTRTNVPGVWPDGRLPCAWELKRFTVPAEARGLDCEILIERVHWSGEVWLNGKKLGGCADGYAPFRVLAGDAVKPGAENVLAVRVGGFAEVPKAKCGKPLFPAGFATAGQGGGGGIMGRVFVRFFNKVRITRAQVIPDIATRTAKVIVRVEGSVPEATVELAISDAKLGPDDGTGALVGNATSAIKLANGVGEATIPVEIKDSQVKLWEPGKPFLYRLTATVSVDGKPADTFSERFGMREVATRPDGFYLNGRKFRLFGTNIIGDMGFWRGAPNLFGRDKIRAAIIEPARAMNAVCIRTHTAPIPKWWLDVCDEAGLLVLLEFPVTVNCGKIDFDETELAAFKKNLMDEAAAVVPHLANHPSIAMWVMTNESNNWHEWERTGLWRHFKSLDPSRPSIRASYETPDARDIHSYAATWKGSCGDFEFRCRKEAEQARKDNVPVMITEYLDGLDPRITRKWFGPAADSPDPKVRERLAVQTAEYHAERGMEQTEAARRLGYQCILPFGPGFYAAGPGRAPRPIDFAVTCALAPVGVSIDLANQHFVAGRLYKADVWVMNDTDKKAAVKLQFSVLDSDPGWDPASPGAFGEAGSAASLSKPVWQAAFDVEVGPHATVTHAFDWVAPPAEGRYFLVARIEPPGAKPVISRRAVYSIPRTPPPSALAGRKVLVIEEPDKKGDRKFSAYVGKLGCKLVDAADLAIPPGPAASQPDVQLVVVAPGSAGGEAFKALATRIPGYVQRGGHVLVLEQFNWSKLKDLLNIQIERTDYDFDDDNAPADQRADSVMARVSQDQASGGSSRVFRWEQPERAIWRGIPDEYLFRWNGRHGRVARVSMSTLPGRARVLVKYAEAERDDLKFVPVAAVPHVQGEVLYFMLDVAGRFDPAAPDFDPVVERVMMNLLSY